MLRSSREGRKQAARFHAFPPSHSSISSRFYNGNNGTAGRTKMVATPQMPRPLDRGPMNGSLLRQTAASALDSDEESEASYPFTASLGSTDDCNDVNIISASLGRGPSIVKYAETEALSKLEKNGINEGHDITLFPLPSRVETPSREMTEEHSQSREYSSSLSSPPTSHLDEGSSTLEHVKNWQEDLEPYKETGPTLEDCDILEVEEEEEEEEESEIASKPSGQRHEEEGEPRSMDLDLMINQRSARIKVKSLRMVEAEETLAISPKSKKMLKNHVEQDQTLLTTTPGSASSSTTARTRTGMQRHDLNKSLADASNFLSTSPTTGNDVQMSAAIKRRAGRPLGMTNERILERKNSEMAEQEMSGEKWCKTSTPDTIKKELQWSTDSLTRRRSLRLTEPLQAIINSRSDEKEPMIAAKEMTKIMDEFKEKETSSRGDGPSTEKVEVASTAKTTKAQKPVWKRKTYLSSGLYSDDYKHENTEEGSSQKSLKIVRDTLARGTSRTRKASQVSALPLPTDYGRLLLEEKKDFRLPYSISQEIQVIREKFEANKKPPSYKQISQNRYFSRSKLPGEILICQCPIDGDCGESCVNRQTEYLCHPKHCPCGERCTNIYFGKRKAVKTEVQWYGARGFGLKTLERIPKGGFIDEYRGEVIDFNEAVRRIRDHYKDTGNYYFLMYDAPAGEMLDGGLKGNITRFANHSCDPNCKVQKWLICGTDEARAGEFQVALFAERDIEAGEELTYDYGWSAFAAKAVSDESSSSTLEVCHCGAATCSGFMGVKKSAAAAASGSKTTAKLVKKPEKKRRKLAVSAATSKKREQDGDKTVKSLLDPPAQPLAVFDSAPSTPRKKDVTKSVRKGFMDEVLNRLVSPGNSLSSLSTLSDEDASELGRSADSTLNSPLRKVYNQDDDLLSSTDTILRKRKRSQLGTRFSLPERKEIKSDAKEESRSSFGVSSMDSDIARSGKKDDLHPAKKRLTVKDRVIRVLVPLEKLEEPPLIIDGKRERKLSLKATEQDIIEKKSLVKQKRNSFHSNEPSSSIPSVTLKRICRPVSSSGQAKIEDEKSTKMEMTGLKGKASAASWVTILKRCHTLRNAAGNIFNHKDYPEGTTFYDYKGSPFNFGKHFEDALSDSEQDQLTNIYTREELAETRGEERLEKQRLANLHSRASRHSIAAKSDIDTM